MASSAITANYEIGHDLKSIQVRDPFFFSVPRPMFSRVRNAMKLSFAFYDLSNYLKIQNDRHFWDFTLICEALYFFSLTHVFKGTECNEAIIFVLRYFYALGGYTVFCHSSKGVVVLRSLSLELGGWVYQNLSRQNDGFSSPCALLVNTPLGLFDLKSWRGMNAIFCTGRGYWKWHFCIRGIENDIFA